MAKIEEVISEYSVRNKFNEDIPVYSVTNEKGFCTGYFSKEVASKDKSTYKIVPKGYFAYNPSRINVGSVDWQKYEDRVIVSPLYVVFGVSNRIDRQYLLHYLKSDMMLSFIKEYATGSVRDNLKLADLGKFPINLRPVEEQRQIAATLDKIDGLIVKRKQQLDKLDELVKSRFIEMFGDPVTNPKRWQRQRFDELCENLDSRRIPITSTDRKAGIYPYYGASGIVDYVENYIFDEELLLISEDGANLVMRSTPIAFSISGKTWVNNHAHVVRFTSLAMQKYIEICFALTDISESITGTAQPKLNQAKLNAMLFCVPPFELQNQFAAFVEQTDKSKSFDDLETAA